MEPAPDGSYRDFEQRGDFFVTPAIEVLEDHDSPVLGAEFVEGRLDDEFPFDAFECDCGVRLGRDIHGFRGQAEADRVRPPITAALAMSPVFTEREVYGDPVNPRIERALSVELIELLEGPHERVLEDVLGILGGAQEPQDGRVETILVSPHQDAERLGLT